jgi:hypothetical protein
MPVVYKEFYKGLTGDVIGLKLEVPFTVLGTSNEVVAKNAALAGSPVARSGLWRNNITLDHQGADVWRGVIHYGQFERAEGKWNLSFDTTGGTLHVAHSKALRAKYGTNAPHTVGTSAPIGAHGDQVDGADIIIPALKLTWTFHHPLAVITLGQIKRLAQITGMTNSATWQSFEANELLFLGCTGNEGTDAETQVQYSFAASQNATGLTIGSISSIAKKGHDYLDVRWKDNTEVVGAETQPIKEAQFVFCHRVYDECNFTTEFGF